MAPLITSYEIKWGPRYYWALAFLGVPFVLLDFRKGAPR